MKILLGLAGLLAITTSTPVSDEQIWVQIDCTIVGQERAAIDQLLADPVVPREIERLSKAKRSGKFSEADSQSLLELQVARLNLQVRDAILEHGQFLCDPTQGRV